VTKNLGKTKKTGMLLLVALVAVLAGCGSTRTVTKVVRVKPCVTAKQMSACVASLVKAYRGDGVTVQVRCRGLASGDFACLTKLSDKVLGDGCDTIVARLVGPGTVFPASDNPANPNVCAKAFPSA
jgi:hypothetical protein